MYKSTFVQKNKCTKQPKTSQNILKLLKTSRNFPKRPNTFNIVPKTSKKASPKRSKYIHKTSSKHPPNIPKHPKTSPKHTQNIPKTSPKHHKTSQNVPKCPKTSLNNPNPSTIVGAPPAAEVGDPSTLTLDDGSNRMAS